MCTVGIELLPHKDWSLMPRHFSRSARSLFAYFATTGGKAKDSRLHASKILLMRYTIPIFEVTFAVGHPQLHNFTCQTFQLAACLIAGPQPEGTIGQLPSRKV